MRRAISPPDLVHLRTFGSAMQMLAWPSLIEKPSSARVRPHPLSPARVRDQGKERAPGPKKPSRKSGTLLYVVGVDSAKSTIYGRLKIGEAAPGCSHSPADRTLDYFEQLLSEALVTSYARGVPVREWRRKKGVRGEALDCRVYAFAGLQALIAMGLALERECERLHLLATNASPRNIPRITHSQWMRE